MCDTLLPVTVLSDVRARRGIRDGAAAWCMSGKALGLAAGAGEIEERLFDAEEPIPTVWFTGFSAAPPTRMLLPAVLVDPWATGATTLAS